MTLIAKERERNSTSSSQRPPSASGSRPGSAKLSQLARVGSAVTFSSALPRSRIEEVALKLGDLQPRVTEGLPKGRLTSDQSASSRLTTCEIESRPSSRASAFSSEEGIATKLERKGVSSLVAAATLSRLSPTAKIEDALQALCHEPDLPLDEPQDFWECPICFESQETYGWQCPEGHRFCRSCMRHHVKAVAFPRCPQVKCGYDLNVADLWLLKISRKRVEAFEHGKLQTAIETLGFDSSIGMRTETVVHCRQDGCSNVMLVPQSHGRECFACPCGAPSFCTQCGETPYHFHADCKQVKELRQRWLTSVSETKTRRKKRAEAYAELQQRMKADDLLRRDELWKMNNCRLCPQCNRVVEKVDGCNSMKCGQNFHGGGIQSGCGASFDWSQAVAYTSQGAPLKLKPLPAWKDKGIYHPGITCKVCEKPVFGPRLRCIHCESFDVCADCEEGLDRHELSHVFEIVYKADFDWTKVVLPQGLGVRVVRSGNRLPPRWHGNQFEGKVGEIMEVVQNSKDVRSYKIRIRGHRGSMPELPAEHLMPLFESRWQAERVFQGTWKPGMSEPHVLPVAIFYAVAAAEGALQAVRMLKNGQL